MLTEQERLVINLLGDVWGAYIHLPQTLAAGGHGEDQEDFRYQIHRLQDMVAARLGYREIRDTDKKEV